jgi:hypothetical protein
MIRRKVRARSRGACEAVTPVCIGMAIHMHHTAGRGKNLNNSSLMLDVCHPCHAYIHGNPTESYERGWMVKRNGR